MPPPSGFRYQTFEDPQDDFGVDEEFLRQVVAPTPAPAPVAAPAPAPASFNPVGFDWSQGVQNIGGTIYQPQFESIQLGQGEEGGRYDQGPLQSVLRYKEGQTAPGQTYELLDPTTGKVVGTGKFKEQSHGFFGDLWNLTSQAASDLAPILQYTPLGPAVKAIAAINAAKEGDILPAIASAAGFGGYENVAKAAQAASALKNEDYLGAVLPALQASGIKDIGGYGQEEIGKALNVARAIDKGPLALISAASKYLPTQTSGFMLPETADPTEFWYPSELSEAAPISAPERMAFLEANISEPETVQQLMQQYYPEIYETASVDNEMAKLMRQQELAQAGESALGGIGPNAKELPLINLSGAPAPAPGKAPAAPKKAEGPDLEKLLLASLMMTPQQQARDDYQLAQIGVTSPYGIYGA